MLTADTKRITIIKSFGGASSGRYTNTYDVNYVGDLDGAALVQTAKELALAESRFTSDKVFFIAASIQFAKGTNAAGKKEKPEHVGLGYYGSVNLTNTNPDPEVNFTGLTFSKVPPPETVLAINFSAGRSGVGVHTYRHAIASRDYTGDGGPLVLRGAVSDAENQVWSNYLQGPNQAAPLVMISETGGDPIAHPVTAITVAGIRNRQLENRRTGKGKKTDAASMDPKAIAQQIDNVQSLLSNVEAIRHTDKGASIFTTQSVLAGLAGLAGIAALIKQSHDSGDFGPNLVQ